LIQKAVSILVAASIVVALLAGTSRVRVAAADVGSPSVTCSTADLSDIMAVYIGTVGPGGAKAGAPSEPPTTTTPGPIPAGVMTYLEHELKNRLDECARELTATGRAQACIADERSNESTNPRMLWQHLQFCAALLRPTRENAQVPNVLVRAQEPTIYVLLGSGALGGGPPSGGGGTPGSAPSGAKSAGGSATGSTATGSSVDNADALLLFVLARRLEYGICERNDRLPPGASRNLVQDADRACHANHPVAVIPESAWTVEDFRTQCVQDPYSTTPEPNESTEGPHGTLGGIILNGAVRTEDGTFNLFTITGGSEESFGAQVVDCSAKTWPPLSTVWSDNVSNGNKTTAFSLFPVAIAGTIEAARWAAHAASLPAPGPSASPNVLAAYLDYETGVAIGSFASSVSGLTIGNPSSGLTLEHASEAWANSFERDLSEFCELKRPSICGGDALDMLP
jgi:hypothetical protein